MSNEKSASEYAFFLSYARKDARDAKGEISYFKDFKDDLTKWVSSALGPVAELEKDIAFYDQESIPLGADWDAELRRALQTSRVMICLFSPHYFASEYCGKEFEVFSRRVKAYTDALPQGARAPQLILPVLWEKPDNLQGKMPEVLKGLQFSHGSLGDDYAKKGLQRLLWRQRPGNQEEAAYKEFIDGLVDIVVREFNANRQVKPLAELPPLPKVPSAFHVRAAPPPPPGGGGAARNAEPAEEAGHGVEVLWLYCFAGGKGDYAGLRQRNECYGNAGPDWRPYLPDDDKMIDYTASVIATSNGLTARLQSVDDADIVQKLRVAEDNNTIVAIVVDPWAFKLPNLKKKLEEYDKARLTNCGVVVLWNDKDKETQDARKDLQALLVKTFPTSFVYRDVTFQHDVNSKGDLEKKLAQAIKEVKLRVQERGRYLRGEPPPAEAIPTLPPAGAGEAGGGR
ncbi:MAG TPA: FxsC protein [Pyrinomonadaceae bacterium]|nr:FxsC protein [Pyrinomonadaceae bacterium]